MRGDLYGLQSSETRDPIVLCPWNNTEYLNALLPTWKPSGVIFGRLCVMVTCHRTRNGPAIIMGD